MRYYPNNMKENLNILLKYSTHCTKMIAIGFCGLSTIIYSESSEHNILLLFLGMYVVLYSITNLFKIK
jgi:hypothetical protein